jgi:hypothetical protein
MKPTPRPATKPPPVNRNEGEELAQFVLQNMSIPDINRFLGLLAHERGVSYKENANPGPDVFTTIRRHINSRTARLYLAELTRRKQFGESLVQRSTNS